MGLVSFVNQTAERAVSRSTWLGQGTRTRTLKALGYWLTMVALLFGSLWLLDALYPITVAVMLFMALWYGLMLFAFVSHSPGVMRVALWVLFTAPQVTFLGGRFLAD